MDYKEILAKRKSERLKRDNSLSLEGFLKDYNLRKNESTSKDVSYTDLDLDYIKLKQRIPDKAYFIKRR